MRYIPLPVIFLTVISVCLIYVMNTYSLSQVNLTQEKEEKIAALMNQIYDNGQLYGTILIAVDGKIIYKNAHGYANLEWNVPHTLDTRFRVASVTKPFTAMLILQ